MEYSTLLAEVQLPAEVKEVDEQSLYEEMKRVKDKRKRRGKRYTTAVVLTLLIVAKLAGETKVSGIVEWVSLRAEELAKRLPLRKGKAPCANTYRYVCEHLDIGELNEVLGAYFAQSRADKSRKSGVVIGEASAGEGEPMALASAQAELSHLALDGKSLRGTRRTGEAAKAAVHTVGLYNVTDEYMWKQQAVTGKGQERQAALALVEPLDLHNTVVSADALHTQPKWTQAVLERGGEYLLIAKGNQAELREAIALLFQQPPRPFLFPEGQAQSVDKAHGRLEIRHLRVSCELNEYLAPRWPQVAQVFRIERTITRHGKTTHETAYGLTSLSLQQAPPPYLLTLIRQHWHIENRTHWRRDVTLGEDACLVSVGQVPHVLATLNNAVLAFVDFLNHSNLASALRYFNAFPNKALDLLLLPRPDLTQPFFV